MRRGCRLTHSIEYRRKYPAKEHDIDLNQQNDNENDLHLPFKWVH